MEAAWGREVFPRVLILTIHIGSEHLRAAQALHEAFRRLGTAHDVRVADTMQHTRKLSRRLFLGAYHDIVRTLLPQAPRPVRVHKTGKRRAADLLRTEHRRRLPV